MADIEAESKQKSEPSYIETVQQVKRTKKQRRRAKQGRKAKSLVIEENRFLIRGETRRSSGGEEDPLADLIEAGAEEDNSSEYITSYFSALALLSEDSE